MDLHEKVAKSLERGRELVDAGWCQRTMAVDKDGRPVDWDGPEAACFCMWGAAKRGMLDTCGPSDAHHVGGVLSTVLHLLAYRSGSDCITDYNDRPGRRKEEVVAAYDAAIVDAHEWGPRLQKWAKVD